MKGYLRAIVVLLTLIALLLALLTYGHLGHMVPCRVVCEIQAVLDNDVLGLLGIRA